jgi:hypothetical protein
MNDELEHVVQRTRQYWFSDGLAELSIGGIFIFLGAYFFVQSQLQPRSLMLIILQAGFILAIFGSIYLGRRLVSRFKSRLTYPRTGYVTYKQGSKTRRLLSIGLVLTMATLIVGLFLTTTIAMNWIPAITGLIVSIIWLISAARVGLIRFYVQSLLSLLLGMGLSLASLETYQSLAVYYAVIGLVLILSGGLTQIRYLRQNPPLKNDSPA